MKKLLILLFSITIITSACNRDKTNNPNPENPSSMEDLNISSSFDWKTTKDIQLTVKGNTSNIVEVTSNEGIPYQKGFITANITYTMKLTVPSYEDSIYLYYLGNKVGLELKGENLNYNFN